MEDKDWNLLDRFLRGTLPEKEVSSLNKRLQKEEELQDALKFEITLRNTRIKNNREKLKHTANRRNQKDWRWLFLFGLVLLLLLGWWVIGYQNQTELLPVEEQKQELQKIINQNPDDFDVVASDNVSWQNAFKNAVNSNSKDDWAKVVQILEIPLGERGDPCRPAVNAYYLGIINLYYYRAYSLAEPLLACVYEKEIKYQSQIDVMMIIIEIGKRNYQEAELLLGSSEVTLEDLPASVVQVYKENTSHEN